MALLGNSITEFDFFPDSPQAIVGVLVTGQTVNIQLWEDGVAVAVAASGCTEIDTTGRYSWSIGSGVSVLTASRQQFHWRMTDGSNTDEGDFVLIAHENRDGGMPSLNNKSSYIK